LAVSRIEDGVVVLHELLADDEVNSRGGASAVVDPRVGEAIREPEVRVLVFGYEILGGGEREGRPGDGEGERAGRGRVELDDTGGGVESSARRRGESVEGGLRDVDESGPS